MKAFLILLVILTIISCYPLNNTNVGNFKKNRKIRREKFISCINEKGSENIKKIFSDNPNLKIRQIIEENKDSFTEEDKNIVLECRKRVLNYLKLLRKKFVDYITNIKNRHEK